MYVQYSTINEVLTGWVCNTKVCLIQPEEIVIHKCDVMTPARIIQYLNYAKQHILYGPLYSMS